MKRAILAAIFLSLFSVVTPAQAHLGPSFDCSKAKTPFPELICSNTALSRLDLKFAQAYFALRQQVGQAGESALLQQAIAFHRHVKQVCGIPAAGPLPADTSMMDACVTREYRGQRQRWIGRLSGAALQEATMPLREHVKLQRDLRILGFLPGSANIDGVYGSETRTAIKKWETSSNAFANITKKIPVTGILSNRQAQLLQAMVAYKETRSTQYRYQLQEAGQCVIQNVNNYVFAHPAMGMSPMSSIRSAEAWAKMYLRPNGSVSILSACAMAVQSIIGMEKSNSF